MHHWTYKVLVLAQTRLAKISETQEVTDFSVFLNLNFLIILIYVIFHLFKLLRL